jgi:Na+-driven multidrug efflux pump
MYICLLKFLQTQTIVIPPMIVGIVGIILNVPLNMIFIWALDMGLVGIIIIIITIIIIS